MGNPLGSCLNHCVHCAEKENPPKLQNSKLRFFTGRRPSALKPQVQVLQILSMLFILCLFKVLTNLIQSGYILFSIAMQCHRESGTCPVVGNKLVTKSVKLKVQSSKLKTEPLLWEHLRSQPARFQNVSAVLGPSSPEDHGKQMQHQ